MQFGFEHDFGDNIDIVCPSCARKAMIVRKPVESSSYQYKLSCIHCGANKTWVDYFYNFKYQLWYCTTFKEHTLSAINLKHLSFLKLYIGEKLRERRPDENGWSNRSIQSRLPKWMLSAANREQLIKKIEELENK